MEKCCLARLSCDKKTQCQHMCIEPRAAYARLLMTTYDHKSTACVVFELSSCGVGAARMYGCMLQTCRMMIADFQPLKHKKNETHGLQIIHKHLFIYQKCHLPFKAVNKCDLRIQTKIERQLVGEVERM